MADRVKTTFLMDNLFKITYKRIPQGEGTSLIENRWDVIKTDVEVACIKRNLSKPQFLCHLGTDVS